MQKHKVNIAGAILIAGLTSFNTAKAQSLFAENLGSTPSSKFVPIFSGKSSTLTNGGLNFAPSISPSNSPSLSPNLATAIAPNLSEDYYVNNGQYEPGLVAFNEPVSTYRFEGEDSFKRFTFEHDLVSDGAFAEVQVAYKNAVSVMPEASSIYVTVNGQTIGTFTIASSSHFKKEKFIVPATMLIDGENVVEMRAIQRHRVDCSLDATYELWTEIDHTQTGVKIDGTNTYKNFVSLKKIARSENGLTDLRLVLPPEAGIETVNEALPLVQTIAVALGRDDISVTVSDRPGVGAGVDLFLAKMNAAHSNHAIVERAGMGLTILPSMDERRAAIVFKAASAQQIHAQLLSAIQGPLKPLIDKAIHTQNYGQINAVAGATYKLSDAGYKTKPFAGRLFRTNFDLNLPGDFYPAEYATIDIGLHAATSPGLKPQSQLLVRVNGKIVKSLPMRDTDGEVFEGRRIELPMRAFRPGKNQIEILAEVERATDDQCSYSERDETTPRFILLENTDITVPKLARVSRLPDLAVFAGTSYPYIQDDVLNTYVAHSDSRTLSAALTMITKMGVVTKSPFNAKILLGRPDASDQGNKLVIAPRRAFTQSQHSATELSREMANQVIFHDADWLPDLVTTASTNAVPIPRVIEATSDDLLRAFKQETKVLSDKLSLTARISQKFEEFAFKFNSWLRYEPIVDHNSTSDIQMRRGDLVQTMDRKTNAISTWLTADTPEDVVRASMVLADPTIWAQLQGSDVVIDLKAKKISATQSSQYQVHAYTDKTPSNLRRLSAAWFSDNFLVYVAMVLVFIGLFSAWMARAVKRVGVRTDK